MTVQELYEACQSYMQSHSDGESHKVLVCDDGMQAKFFATDSAFGTSFSKEVKPARLELQRVRVKVQLPDIEMCKKLGVEVPKAACNHQCDACCYNGECIETVGQWRDNVPVEVEPAQYVKVPVLVIAIDTIYEEK